MPASSLAAFAETLDPSDDVAASSPDTLGEASGEAGSEGASPVEMPLGYVYYDESAPIAGAVQKIVVSVDEDVVLQSAHLTYTGPEGMRHEVPSSACAESAALFEFQVDGPGAYQLVEMRADATLASGDAGPIVVDLASYGENCRFEAVPDMGAALSIMSEDDDATGGAGETSVFAINEDGDLEETDSIDSALAISIQAEDVSSKARVGEFVIALDPGHGGTDGGASYNGINESDINWKIAQACKSELEKYGNVKVVLTRAKDEYTNDNNGGLKLRVQRAINAGAKVFVSIHINSAGNGGATTASGAEVFYPNGSSYNKETHTTGQELSQNILDQLVALGLGNRGIKTLDSANGSRYPDGSVRDLYGVIANARENGIPGIIVEHAFINNASDNAKLKDDSFLVKLGVADATGIAKTYGLKKMGWEQQSNGTWKYKLENGSYAANGWQKINGKWYWFGSDALMKTGWVTDGGKKYYLHSSGEMQGAGWFKQGNDWYLIADSGAARTGWAKMGSKWYYLDSSSGAMKTGWVTVGGLKYYLNASGAMQPGGWFKQGNDWYLLASSGAAITGWAKQGGTWYYMDPASAAMKTGWNTIYGSKYYFNGSGAMRWGGWFLQDGKWYLMTASGAAATGWAKTGGKWYYMDPSSAVMKTGWVTVGDSKYFLHPSGAMQVGGWFKQGSDWYLIADSGAARTGWAKTGGKWYYMDPSSAVMKTGWVKLGDLWYLLQPSGAMQTGWYKDGAMWYYLKGDGSMAKGWITVGNKQYYMNGSGQMVSGEATVDGKTCYFDGSGAFIGNGTPIMGAAQTDATQMAQALVAGLSSNGKSYPSQALGAGGAPDAATFCKMIYEEATAEGVRPEVLWAQIMWETGWLQFGGDVKINQYNFGGLGATGGGVPGNSFKDVRTGIRAQAQHLKCYACSDPLNGEKVDQRWSNSLRGKAKLVEWLGIPDNPNGTGWAAAKGYGTNLVNLMKTHLKVGSN